MTAILMNQIIGSTTTNEEKNDTVDRVKLKEDNEEKKEALPQQPPIPLLKGTLSYNLEARRHILRGMWNYETPNPSTNPPPQRFELIRTLSESEDVTTLPLNGEFHGSFSLVYIITNSKGKQKERSQVVTESGVQLNFDKIDETDQYTIKGKGTNQFGIFQLIGTAKKDDDCYKVEMRKTYISTNPVPSDKKKKKNFKRKQPSGELPNVTESYPSGVVCLQGKLGRESIEDVGGAQVIHKISGIWSSGLDILKSSPETCQSFDYEHRASSGANPPFPLSGRYSGWFMINGDNGNQTKIQEKDLQLKFIPNNKGYYNVSGKGWNVFGKYSISGVLEKDFTITIFRHFISIKPSASQEVTETIPKEPLTLTLDDVILPMSENPDPIKPPDHGSYSAVSRGIFKINEDGTHTCGGKWAITREHYSNGQTSSFHFGLQTKGDNSFPIDSQYYKGSFKMRRGSTKYANIIDRQIVLKFVKNSSGSYNVHGVGVNSIGNFTLIGTFIPTSSSTSGQVELYRMYPVEQKTQTKSPSHSISDSEQQPVLVRSSSRTSKPPMHLSEDNPAAIQQRMYDKCLQIHKLIKERDSITGSYFARPVDPVALGIPNYYTIITNPMDLQTLMETNLKRETFSVKEFEKNMRLIFENAMTYNEDTTHAVHVAARSLLTLFCMKFKDVERDEERLKEIEKKNSITSSIGLVRSEATVAKKSNKIVPNSSISRGKELPSSSKKESNSILHSKSRKRGNDDQEGRSNKRSKGDYVTRAEFEALKQQMKTMQLMLESFQKNFNGTHTVANTNVTVAPTVKEKPPIIQPPSPAEPKPLTLQEQEVLTESINSISPDKLPGVIQIIRESTKLNGDEEEIDLEIDQLDTATQRKLQQYVLMNVKSETKRKKGGDKKKVVSKKKEKNTISKAKPTKSSASTAPAPTSTNNAPSSQKHPENTTSFFSFGSKGLNQDSDDSDDDSSSASSHKSKNNSPKKTTNKTADSSFLLPDDPKDSNLSSDDSDNEDSKVETKSTNWNKMASKSPPQQQPNSPGNKSTSSSSSEDPLWSSARDQATKNSSLEHIRATQKQKLLQSTTQKQQENYIQSTTKLKTLSEEKAAQQKSIEDKKQQEVQNMREKMRQSYENVEATVDLEEQRNLMKKYESSLGGDYEFGSNSPSSDFGF